MVPKKGKKESEIGVYFVRVYKESGDEGRE